MKYAILGTGNISNTCVRAIAELSGSELVAAVSRSGKRLAADPEIPVWSDLESVPVDYDAVIIATPNGLHCAGVLAAAKLGKQALVEKPLDIRMVDMDQAYYDSGAYRGGYDLDGGGPFIQQASHNIDLYVWFFGLPVQVVSMMDTFTHQMEAEDHGAALLRHPGAMIGTIVASTSARPGFAARLEVHSDKGSFTVIDDAITQWHFKDLPNPANTDFQYKHDGATSAAVSDTSAHKKILADFEQAVRQGSKPIADGQSAMETSKLILDIYQSALK